jgi:hypothetical protein
VRVSELRIVGPFHAGTGYSKFARAALTAALQAGFRVQAVESDFNVGVRGYGDGTRRTWRIPVTDTSRLPDVQAEEVKAAEGITVAPDAPTLLIQMPVQLGGWEMFSDGPRIGWTMIESDTLHPLWARSAANVDLLLTPSQFCHEAFARALPMTPKTILPLPVDDRIYTVEGPKAAIYNRPDFLFFSVFTPCERKGWKAMLQAFTEEFPGERVGIVLKPACDEKRLSEVQEFVSWCQSAGAWIHIIEDWVSEEDLAGLYRACDAFVLPAAEGFGLPYVEAALCGKPSVALAIGGSAEMVNMATGYPIASYLSPCVGHIPPLYTSDQAFPMANVPAIREAMRECVEDRASKGEAARQFALERFTPSAIAPGLKSTVCESIGAWEETQTRYSATLGAALTCPPVEVAVFIAARNVERAKACAERVKKTVPVARIEFLCEESLSFETEPFWTGKTIAEARQSALSWFQAACYKGFVVFLDESVEVSAHWWQQLCHIFALYPQIGILAPKVVSEQEEPRIGYRLRFDASRDISRLNRILTLADGVEMTCMALRPEVWQHLEMDTAFAYFYADADLCAQARSFGYETGATASVTVVQNTARDTRYDYLQEAERFDFLRKWKGAF